ncbi:MAG: hypothetical protein CMA29_02400 [Euryarchaeota archaeon]|nr:hypothetical protein [Euryarchaeota archaeon]
MGVHRLELRAHCSAIDDLAVIRNGIGKLVGEETTITEKVDKSWHGAPQTNFSLEITRKKDVRFVISQLGYECLSTLLKEDILSRIDERNVIHLRLSLAELCCGRIEISEPRKREPCIKLKIKLEVYPGQSVEDIAIECLQDAISSYEN